MSQPVAFPTISPNTCTVQLGLSQKDIDQKIRSINATQITSIAEKMVDIFCGGLMIEPIDILIGHIGQDDKGLIIGCAKEAFVTRAKELFAQEMTADFQYGHLSGLAQTISGEHPKHVYSNENILVYAVETGAYDIRNAIGKHLPKNYQIRLGLDADKMKKSAELVFLVTTVNDGIELPKTSFTLAELENHRF